ncbi:hypothetical protein A2U01_0081598, partial [Trifolium medium]|nr:hypothetical protein [Trifolium medium]
MFQGSIRGFMNVYYLVRPTTEEGCHSIVEVLPDEDAEGNPLLDRNGQVKMANYTSILFSVEEELKLLALKTVVEP